MSRLLTPPARKPARKARHQSPLKPHAAILGIGTANASAATQAESLAVALDLGCRSPQERAGSAASTPAAESSRAEQSCPIHSKISIPRQRSHRPRPHHRRANGNVRTARSPPGRARRPRRIGRRENIARPDHAFNHRLLHRLLRPRFGCRPDPAAGSLAQRSTIAHRFHGLPRRLQRARRRALSH